MTTDFSLSKPSEAANLRARLEQCYEVVEHDVHLGKHQFTLLGIRDTYALLDRISPEEFQRDERLPYWGDLWPSSLALAQWCLEEAKLEGKKVLELGCGLGLAGISAARAGASVIMSDYEDDALAFAKYNSLVNAFPHESISCHLMDWRSPGQFPECDIIIGSDVLYEEKNVDPIIHVLNLKRGQYAVFTDPQRRTCNKFIDALHHRGFIVETGSSVIPSKGSSTTVMRHVVRPGDSRGAT